MLTTKITARTNSPVQPAQSGRLRSQYPPVLADPRAAHRPEDGV